MRLLREYVFLPDQLKSKAKAKIDFGRNEEKRKAVDNDLFMATHLFYVYILKESIAALKN